MSLEQIRACLEASEEVQFAGRNREEVYRWVDQTLGQQNPEMSEILRDTARQTRPPATPSATTVTLQPSQKNTSGWVHSDIHHEVLLSLSL